MMALDDALAMLEDKRRYVQTQEGKIHYDAAVSHVKAAKHSMYKGDVAEHRQTERLFDQEVDISDYEGRP